MTSTNSSRMRSLLSNIIRTSNTILSAVSSGSTPSVPTLTCSTPPTLPPTPNILPELEETGIPPPVIVELLELFNRSCRALRRQTEAAILNTPIQSAKSIRAFETVYLKRVDALKEHLLKKVHGISNKKSSRAVFKSEYTPLLEKYFKGNAFPSSADRAMLARKTQMTHRQIEVWFQNHRRRAREDGKNLSRRLGDSNPDDYNPDTLDAESNLSRSASASPSEDRNETGLPRNNTDNSARVVSVFQWISVPTVDIVKSAVPPHAFPTPFRDDGSIPFTPSYCDFEWDHKASTAAKSIKKSKPIDIDSFGLEFQQRLRIFEKTGTTCLKRKRSDDRITTSSFKDSSMVSHTSKALSSRGSTPPIAEKSQRRPLKRRLIETPRQPCRTSFSTRSRSCSNSSSSSFLTSSTAPTSTASPTPPPSLRPGSSHKPSCQHLPSQNPSWHASKFAEWSLIPPLTLNCATFPPFNQYEPY